MTDANGSAASGQPGANDGAGAGASVAPWYGADAGDDIKGFVELKGWDAPAKAIDGYRNLEKLLGADKAGRGLILPKDDTDAEGWGQVYAKLGRPETADGYKLPLPEGMNDAFVKAIAPKMHELGLSAKQAQGLAEFVNQFETQSAAQFEEQSTAQIAKDLETFKAEMGAAYASTVELGKRAAAALGIKDEQYAALEESLGLKGTVELFASIGKKLGEDTFVSGGEPAGRNFSPEAARAQFEALKGDKDWMARLMSGNVQAKAEKERLDANMLGMSVPEYRAALNNQPS